MYRVEIEDERRKLRELQERQQKAREEIAMIIASQQQQEDQLAAQSGNDAVSADFRLSLGVMFYVLCYVSSKELEILKTKHAEELQGLQELVRELRAKESQLEKDMKKRGDAARQMLVAKDVEIETLKKTIASSSLSSLVAAGKQQQMHQQQEPPSIANAMHSMDMEASVSVGMRGSIDEGEVTNIKRNLDDILSQEEVRQY